MRCFAETRQAPQWADLYVQHSAGGGGVGESVWLLLGSRARLSAAWLRVRFWNHFGIQKLQHTADAKSIDANIQSARLITHCFVQALG